MTCGVGGKECVLAQPYPKEFREDVVVVVVVVVVAVAGAVARGRESGGTIEQIAKDFGIQTMRLVSPILDGEVVEAHRNNAACWSSFGKERGSKRVMANRR